MTNLTKRDHIEFFENKQKYDQNSIYEHLFAFKMSHVLFYLDSDDRPTSTFTLSFLINFYKKSYITVGLIKFDNKPCLKTH